MRINVYVDIMSPLCRHSSCSQGGTLEGTQPRGYTKGTQISNLSRGTPRVHKSLGSRGPPVSKDLRSHTSVLSLTRVSSLQSLEPWDSVCEKTAFPSIPLRLHRSSPWMRAKTHFFILEIRNQRPIYLNFARASSTKMYIFYDY